MALNSARGSQGPPARTPSASPGRNSQEPPPVLPFGPCPHLLTERRRPPAGRNSSGCHRRAALVFYQRHIPEALFLRHVTPRLDQSVKLSLDSFPMTTI